MQGHRVRASTYVWILSLWALVGVPLTDTLDNNFGDLQLNLSILDGDLHLYDPYMPSSSDESTKTRYH